MSSSSSEPIKKRYTLKTSDNEAFDVSEAVTLQSNTIKHLIEDGCSTDDVPIPLPNLTAPVLAKVIEFCKKRVESTVVAYGKDDWWGDRMKEQQPMTEWDTEFLKVDQNMLFDVILAANYLDIKPLLDLTCKSVADMMRGKTTEQIREHFHIKNDYSPEEEAEVRRENAWAFEL